MLKHFDFECMKCGHAFDDYVEGVDGKPDCCPACKATKRFKKLPCQINTPTTIVIDYPGSKKHKAGYMHSHGDRPAEKKESQISMFMGRNKK